MEKHIPYEKLSKKEKRKLDSSKPENSRAYNRTKMKAYPWGCE